TLSNFPNRALGCVLHLLVFPFGARHTGPSDALGAQVAEILGRREGDLALEQILEGVYRPQDVDEPLGALRQALDTLATTQPLTRKLHKAIKSGELHVPHGEDPIQAASAAGIISEEEGIQLRTAETARRKVIDVDDFSKEELELHPGRIR